MPELVRATSSADLRAGGYAYVKGDEIKKAKVVGVGSEIVLLTIGAKPDLLKITEVYVIKSDII